jgi:hypothetical protein
MLRDIVKTLLNQPVGRGFCLPGEAAQAARDFEPDLCRMKSAEAAGELAKGRRQAQLFQNSRAQSRDSTPDFDDRSLRELAHSGHAQAQIQRNQLFQQLELQADTEQRLSRLIVQLAADAAAFFLFDLHQVLG